ncbi:uncharacterized protein LOC141686421 [Apium graveolens]|uniref:uncharacterized protein LOC141686421 n=1 Tax=Apium graveolens TaxID=4045 RepID=UPI003D7B59D6
MNNVNDSDDIINEKDLIGQVESDIKEFKDIQQQCRTNLAMAKALFSTNPTVNELEYDFAKLHELTMYPANFKQRVEKRVPNAKAGTESTDVDIHGMQGIPHLVIATHFGEEVGTSEISYSQASGTSINGPAIVPPPTSNNAQQPAVNVAYLVWGDDAISMEERRMSLIKYQVHDETTQVLFFILAYYRGAVMSSVNAAINRKISESRLAGSRTL